VTNESKIQVKLAQLKYYIVRVKEKVRLSKGGGEEQPGFFGVGKYDADIEILSIKKRTAVLKKKLLVEEKKRKLHRVQRLNEKTPLISLTGYTSAGKTSLFNWITNEKKETSKQLFTTLTTYTRSAVINEKKVLFTDTIGFISKLPPYMIEAFKSTLSELDFADVILLVLDFSDDIISIEKKLKSSLETLSKLEVPNNKLILVLNKMDLVKPSEMEDKLTELNIHPDMHQIVPISSKTGFNIPLLIEKIDSMITAK
jgi:GTP-binding protein HflX